MSRITGKLTRKIGLLLSAVGPGLFLIGYNIGTGSVTTMAETGSRYGMSLFWVLLLSCLFTFVMLVAYGKLTLVTGETSMRAYRKYLPWGAFMAVYTIIALVVGELASLAGNMGIVSTMISEWTRFIFGGRGVDVVLAATVVITGCFWLIWMGKYTLFEKILGSLVALMGVSFLLSMFIAVDEPVMFLKGLLPGVPDNGGAAFINIAAIAGTTCSAMVFIMRGIVLSEKGWGAENMRRQTTDAAVCAGMMLLLSAAVMACSTGAIFLKGGQPVTRAVDMVKTLEPLAGKYAISILVTGIIGAGISSMFPIALIAPWLICDYTGRKRNLASPLFRVLGAVGLLVGFTVPVFKLRPVWVMLASQVFLATILPYITVAAILLLNDRRLMGKHKAGLLLNLGLWATFVFSIFTSLPGILDLAAELNTMAAGYSAVGRIVLAAVAVVIGAVPFVWIVIVALGKMFRFSPRCFGGATGRTGDAG